MEFHLSVLSHFLWFLLQMRKGTVHCLNCVHVYERERQRDRERDRESLRDVANNVRSISLSLSDNSTLPVILLTLYVMIIQRAIVIYYSIVMY